MKMAKRLYPYKIWEDPNQELDRARIKTIIKLFHGERRTREMIHVELGNSIEKIDEALAHNELTESYLKSKKINDPILTTFKRVVPDLDNVMRTGIGIIAHQLDMLRMKMNDPERPELNIVDLNNALRLFKDAMPILKNMIQLQETIQQNAFNIKLKERELELRYDLNNLNSEAAQAVITGITSFIDESKNNYITKAQDAQEQADEYHEMMDEMEELKVELKALKTRRGIGKKPLQYTEEEE